MTKYDGAVLELEGLTKNYSGVTVVDDVSIRVRPGEIYGILGTNGAGKTTTVECAQGLRRPDAGRVRVLGCDPFSERSSLLGRVGSQLQESQLPERLRVGEAIRLFARDRQEVDQAMTAWTLSPLAKKPFGSLSGGQRQRLFLALALLNQPEVVFLDELTQGLDPDARRSVWRLIERVSRTGTTVVLVTHFMEEAEALCDRVAVMDRGRVVAEDTPKGLIDRFGPGVRVRFEGDVTDLDWLGRVPGVGASRIVGSDVECSGLATMVAHLGHELIERGRAGIALRVQQPSLENALQTLLEAEEV